MATIIDFPYFPHGQSMLAGRQEQANHFITEILKVTKDRNHGLSISARRKLVQNELIRATYWASPPFDDLDRQIFKRLPALEYAQLRPLVHVTSAMVYALPIPPQLLETIKMCTIKRLWMNPTTCLKCSVFGLHDFRCAYFQSRPVLRALASANFPSYPVEIENLSRIIIQLCLDVSLVYCSFTDRKSVV